MASGCSHPSPPLACLDRPRALLTEESTEKDPAQVVSTHHRQLRTGLVVLAHQKACLSPGSWGKAQCFVQGAEPLVSLWSAIWLAWVPCGVLGMQARAWKPGEKLLDSNWMCITFYCNMRELMDSYPTANPS